MAQHIVTAPLVVVTNHDGSQLYLYGGAPVPPSLPEGELQRHIDSGMIAEVDQPEPSGAGAGEPTEDERRITAFLDRSADEVIADVGTLSDEDRGAVAAAEEAGKARVTVLRALAEPSGAGTGAGE